MGERKIILLLSGEIGSGKSTLAKSLEEKFGFKVLRTRDAIKELGKKHFKTEYPERQALQEFGAALDKKDNGKWVLNYFQEEFQLSLENDRLFIIDSVRIKGQIDHFRKAYSFVVFHIHFLASPELLKKRYLARAEVSSLNKKEQKHFKI